MPKYQVQINAKNFLINLDGTTGKYGFITVRLVDAPDSTTAENTAVQMLRGDQERRALAMNEQTDPPQWT